MSSFGPSSRARRLALAAGGALALALSSAPGASAQFTIDPCGGAAAPGQGATFQTSAVNGFKAVFQQESPIGCGAATANFITYAPSGSGAGRAALGERTTANPTGARHVSDRWAGVDDAPPNTQRRQIETGPIDANGQDVTTADDGKLHVVPVAIGSIAVIVNLPTGCTGYGTAELFNGDRPKVTLENLEAAWYGATATTWGDLIPNIPAANCGDQTVTRVVRFDSSGTTFAFKQFMTQIAPAHTLWRTLANQGWPNSPAGPNPVKVATTTGGSGMTSTVGLTPGSIGYVDLATARAATVSGGFTYATDGSFDRTFWLPLQRAKGSATYDDPQADPNGYKNDASAALRGSSCKDSAPTTFPTSSYGDWSAVDSTLTGKGYAACTLTYDLAFDDNAVVYCNSPEEQAKARTIKDYLQRAVISEEGQKSLASRDYARLPADIYAISLAAVTSIDWNKGGMGRPCSDEPPPPPPPAASPTPTPGGTTPPPPPPSNNATISSARVSGTTIRLSLQLPGAGKVSIASTTKPKKGKTIKLATKNVTIAKSGAQTINVTLSSKAKSALRKDKKLKVTLKITFAPNGGSAKTITRNVTVKQPKKKK